MKRILLLTFVLAAALALPPTASARIVELGGTADAASLNCPGTTEAPCVAAVRMTGLPGARLGRAQEPVLHPPRRLHRRVHGPARRSRRRGDRLLQRQLRHAVDGAHLGAAPGHTRKTRLNHRLIRQSDRFELDRTSARGPRSCSTSRSRSRRATGSRSRCPPGRRCCSRRTWRGRTGGARRGRKGSCEPPESLRQFALEDLREVAQFGCTYHGARLLYTVTYIPSNHVTNEHRRLAKGPSTGRAIAVASSR